jgi:hypothetical protein
MIFGFAFVTPRAPSLARGQRLDDAKNKGDDRRSVAAERERRSTF